MADHDLSRHPAILYWYDWDTLTALAAPDDDDTHRAVGLVTRVEDATETSETKETRYPLAPAAAQVGQFPVSAAVHAGYAVTWYGLALAGGYMLRLLLAARGKGL